MKLKIIRRFYGQTIIKLTGLERCFNPSYFTYVAEWEGGCYRPLRSHDLQMQWPWNLVRLFLTSNNDVTPKMTSSPHLVLNLYTQTLNFEKCWPSISGRGILFDSSKIMFLAHLQHSFEARTKNILSSNDFLFPITLAGKTQNYYYYFYQFYNIIKSHLCVNDISDWLEIFRTPPGHQSLLSKIRFFDDSVLTKSYGSKPLKIGVFLGFHILVCKIHTKHSDVIKPF